MSNNQTPRDETMPRFFEVELGIFKSIEEVLLDPDVRRMVLARLQDEAALLEVEAAQKRTLMTSLQNMAAECERIVNRNRRCRPRR
jgi:hypothetical protein